MVVSSIRWGIVWFLSSLLLGWYWKNFERWIMNDSDAISITVFTTSRHSDEIPLYYSAFIVHCKSDKDIKGN